MHQITYIIPIQSHSISFLNDQSMDFKDAKYVLYFPTYFSPQEKEKIFQKLHSFILQNENIYLFYQYPKWIVEKDWIQILSDFTDFDDKILFIDDWKEEKWRILKKARHLEYQKMNYQKLRILLSKNDLWINTIFYHQEFPSPYHILSIKKRLSRQLISPPFSLLSNYLLPETTLQPLDQSISLSFHVIHMEHRKDRETKITKNLQKHKIPFSFHIAQSISHDLISLNRFHFAKSSYEYVKGALGCRDSHQKLIQKFYEKNEESYLVVLEDDFHFYPYLNIYSILKNMIYKMNQQNENWTILYLTLNLSNRSRSLSTQDFYIKQVPKGEGLATAGYIVNRNRYERVLEVIDEIKCEIDVGYAKYLEERYYVDPYLGYPYETYSDIQHEITHYDFMY